MRGACEEDAAEREKRAAMDVMFVAMVAMLTIVESLLSAGRFSLFFGGADELTNTDARSAARL